MQNYTINLNLTDETFKTRKNNQSVKLKVVISRMLKKVGKVMQIHVLQISFMKNIKVDVA